jgi:sulfite exporter TauE/SafE
MVFGLLYFVWGLRRALRNRSHQHPHFHKDGTTHMHTHSHIKEHLHVHTQEDAVNLTPWILFTIFVFGPCEPLIPILMYPAAKNSFLGMVEVTAVFGLTTIATMLGIVLVSTFGMELLPFKKLERYTQALAGLTIFLCGMAIQFLGL